jgi:hypothetical protein
MLEIGLGNTQAQETWRKLMSVPTYFPGRGTIIEQTYLKGKAEGEAEGEARAKAQSILRLLWRRGIPVQPDTQKLISDCTDLKTLERWFDRAITVEQIGDLFTVDEIKPAT